MARSSSRERRGDSPGRRSGRSEHEPRRDQDVSRRERIRGDRPREEDSRRSSSGRDRSRKEDAHRSGSNRSDSHRSSSHRSSSHRSSSHRGSHDRRRSRSPSDRTSAARVALRSLLGLAPALEDEVVKLAKTLDDGRSISIDGLRDPSIRASLGAFLDALPGSRRSSSGKRYLSREAPSAESLVKREVARFRDSLQAEEKNAAEAGSCAGGVGGAQPSSSGPGRDASADAVPEPSRSKSLHGAVPSQKSASESPLPRKPIIGPSLPPRAAAPPIGPQLPPKEAASTIGPQLPPGFSLPPSSPASSSSSSIGPALPGELVEPGEDAESGDVRGASGASVSARPASASSEVDRLLSVMGAHAAENALRAKEGAPPRELDAYELLGLPPSATPKEAAKRYRQLSLRVHPDRCRHPQAHEAFDALKRAAQALEDADARASLDQQREEEDELVREVARKDEEERRQRWRRAFAGEGEAGGAGGGTADTGSRLAKAATATTTPATREAWMTELPPAQARAVGSLFGGGVATGGGGATFSQSKQTDIDPSWGRKG